VVTQSLVSAALVVATALVATAGLAAMGCASSGDEVVPGAGPATPPVVTGDAALALAFDKHAGDFAVEDRGTVVRVLADDTEGGRHQRFILRLASGQTLLVAHNIDVAPRIDDLVEGDVVEFRGVYEWNDEGGTIHHDPQGEHAPGWLRHEGRTYE